ncbi:reverse transcriptase RNA-dependent DNA polymerase [Nitzschia inconspicua]|uniref:Reverse transcriptase RNA-dependent DNA polymerase n=1 Tax=Nitzschia inconspicua TaxID=303405 RepID=A0A9K3LMR4_9STRA|nr:reverse transcriptase RNA-dependent DNA polymerase [Nitzschia inconspicua]
MNSIKDCPVTVDDINLAEKIYGPDVATIKGKATRTRPIPVVNDIIEIPKELIAAQHDVEMSIDTLFVNSMPFLATISHNIKYRTCNFVPSRRMMDYRSVLAKVVLLYTNAGFTIKMIHADSEYRAVLEYFKNSSNKIDYNLATANEHVPQAERNIRTIKERVRATYHSLPFKAIPKLFIKELMAETANKLNFFPPKNGVSEYYSPREILSHQRLDYTKNCTIPQFSYVQAYDEPEPRNSQAARSLDCIYLRPVNNLQGGHVLYHFGTKGTITRRKVKVIPITASVIEAVERLAKADGIKSLVLHNKDGTIFYDSSWIAGVDHTQNEDYDNIYDDSDYESSGSETDVDLEPDYDAEQDNYDEHGDSQENSIQEELSYADQSIDDEDIDEEGDGIDQLDLIFQENNEDEEEEAQNEDTEHDAISEGSLRRSSRQSHVSDRLQSYREQTGKNYSQRHYEVLNYDLQDARVIAMIMLYQRDNTYAIEYANVTTYSLKTAIKKFGMRATKAAHKEMKQLHDRDCWEPIHPKDLKDIEMKRALRTIFFITQKSNGDIKGRTCADGSVQRNWIGRDEVSSPTVSTESIILTGMIEAHEKRDVGTCDIPNAFVQTHLDKHDKDGNRTIMKLEGPLVQILCEIDPTYTKYLIKVKGQKVLYVHLIKALYGMLVSAMLFCKKLKQDLIEYGFEINPYDPCVANKMVNGKQLTVTWHVDDLKVSHIQPSVVTEFMQWVKTMYGKIGEVKITRGKVHEYLGMKLIYNSNGSLTIDMSDYIQSMIDTFPSKELEGKSVSLPWNDNLFKVTKGSNKLEKKKAEQFHTTTAQGLFACKRARPDINPVIAFLTTRVKEPTQEDWMKLVRMMKYLLKTKLDSLTLKLSNDMIIKWYVDAAFAVHPDMKSQTGFTAIFGQGAPICTSRKQILNTRSSTEAELVGADDAAGPMLWTMRFMHSQGYKIKTVLYQDNKAAILMETNGRASAGKRSRHIDIRYFFIYDMKEKGLVKIHYCPTDKMIADYMTKPLHGNKFSKFRKIIMGQQNLDT